MNFRQNLRIVLAIAAKDINDAIKNKIIQGILIGAALMMFSSQALSLLVRLKDEPTAYYWDQSKSVAIQEIRRSRVMNFYRQDDFNHLQASVSQSVEPVLGVLIPEGFDHQVEAGNRIELQAYYLHWLPAAKIADLVSYFEKQLSQLLGVTIILNIGDHQLYPPKEGKGYPMMMAIGIVLGVMIVGLILTPYLLVDEKETHTLEALLISPARIVHLLFGKSLAGLFYSLTASLLILIFNWRWIVHWDLILLAVLLGGLSAVSIGLLVGATFDNPTTVNMLISLLIAGLMLPIYFWTYLASRLSPLMQSVIATLPSLAMYKLIRQSFTETATSSIVIASIISILGWVVVMLALVIWRIRRLDLN